MKKYLFVLLTGFLFSYIEAQTWRSSLYPIIWENGFSDNQGRFLHDFSYAGYHYGEVKLPRINGTIIDVTQAPYYADNTGTTDVTSLIQAAIDTVGMLGGGVVFLPEGTYLLSAGENYCLWIHADNIVLRGAGINSTLLLNSSTSMRSKNIIEISPDGNNNWYSPNGASILLTSDAHETESTVFISETVSFEVGDLVVLTSDFTPAFIDDHKMAGKWNSTLPGVAFARTIRSIDNSTQSITFDIPLRYYLKTRDNARIYKLKKQLEECGLEDFSMGNIENPKTTGWGEEDYNIIGNGAYDVHGSYVVNISNSQNCWVKNIATFKPETNAKDIHILSNGFQLYQSRLITIDSCSVEKSQYEGGGGNGYLFSIRSNDCIIKNSIAHHGRHNFNFRSAFSNGNVIYNCTSQDPVYVSDYHMHLSMSNLFDNPVLKGDQLEAAYRPYGSILHGHTTSQSVFWNARGERYKSGTNAIIKSEQWGYGYVIGTQGSAPHVLLSTANNTSPQDFLEGEARSEYLRPFSLYKDQLLRRMYGIDSIDGSINEIPVLIMSTTNDTVDGPFTLTMAFSEKVMDFEESDLSITQGTIESGTFSTLDSISYEVIINPSGTGEISIEVKNARVQNLAGYYNIGTEYRLIYRKPNSIQTHRNSLNINFFPNPAHDKLFLQSDNTVSSFRVTIYSATGKTCYRNDSFHTNESIDLLKMLSGVYFIRVNSDKNSVLKKIIIN